PLEPPPFPTRRSSDLGELTPGRESHFALLHQLHQPIPRAGRQGHDGFGGVGPSRGGEDGPAANEQVRDVVTATIPVHHRRGRVVDRKSTRLNSSHVKI